MINKSIFRVLVLVISCICLGFVTFGADSVFPEKPSPPRLVNDFAKMMNPGQQAELEAKLLEFERNSSTQITIVTITSLGEYDISDYTIKLGKLWGVGKEGKNNGVVILAALQEHKIWIATGKGLEGALTDYKCGKIRDKMKPFMKSGQYFEGFSEGANDVIAATKGEFNGDGNEGQTKGSRGVPRAAIIIIIIFVVLVIKMTRRGGGGNNRGGGGGWGNFATGMLLGNMLSGGRGGGGFGGGSGGDSGFGGFGGGDFGGGGAGGSWD